MKFIKINTLAPNLSHDTTMHMLVDEIVAVIEASQHDKGNREAINAIVQMRSGQAYATDESVEVLLERITEAAR